MRLGSKPASVLAVALATMCWACGVPDESEPRPINSANLPESLRPEAATGSGSNEALENVSIWLVDDERLVSASHGVARPVTPLGVLQALGSGPTEAEQDSGLRSAIPDAQVFLDALVTAGTATVELTESFDQIPATDQALAIGQIVLTLTSLRGVGQVSFERAGIPIAVPLPNGQTADGRVSADDFAPLTG